MNSKATLTLLAAGILLLGGCGGGDDGQNQDQPPAINDFFLTRPPQNVPTTQFQAEGPTDINWDITASSPVAITVTLAGPDVNGAMLTSTLMKVECGPGRSCALQQRFACVWDADLVFYCRQPVSTQSNMALDMFDVTMQHTLTLQACIGTACSRRDLTVALM